MTEKIETIGHPVNKEFVGTLLTKEIDERGELLHVATSIAAAILQNPNTQPTIYIRSEKITEICSQACNFAQKIIEEVNKCTK